MAEYYVSPSGDDGNAGTIGAPWYSINHAWTVVGAGDTVWMRGGTYSYTEQQYLTGVNGSSGNLVKIWAYSGEVPIISKGGSWSWTSHRALIWFVGNYIHFKGLTVTGNTNVDTYVWMAMYGHNFNNCILEHCEFSWSGLGAYMDGASSGNLFLNCDWHNNYDPYSNYENADGINFEQVDAGGTNTFTGCRCWNNSDDGFDFYGNQSFIQMTNCWAWGNGFQEDQSSLGGDGNGFKLGSASVTSTAHLRTLNNCVSFGNYHWGIDDNGSDCQMKIFNCITHANGHGQLYVGGYHLNAPVAHYIRNCVSFDDSDVTCELDGGYNTNIDHNSWDIPITVTSADFVSITDSQLAGARDASGGLPVMTYLHLVTASDLKAAGIAISGLTLDGDGNSWLDPPSLGAFEFGTAPPASVPNTTTFSLQDVCNVIQPSVNNLVTCFTEADSASFDPTYEGDMTSLYNFRNYNG